MSPIVPTAQPSFPLLPGLELQTKIGEGGMGVVYRALHVTLQRIVAVKVLQPQPETTIPWTREAQTLAALAHPNVVTIHDAGEVAGQRYLVMEYLDGGDLRRRITRGRPWELAAVRGLFEQITLALNFIHSQGILHLDLKPENILFSKENQLKLADFGLAHLDHDATLFETGRFVGSLDYIAPEYRAGLTIDARYDVFALATILYELLTGRLPGRVFVPVSQRNPLVPPELDEVLRRALLRDPAERYPTVAAFHQAFCAVNTPALRRWSLLGSVPVRVASVSILVGSVALGVYWATRGPAEFPDVPDMTPPNVAASGLQRLWVVCERASDAAFVCTSAQARLHIDKVDALTIANPSDPVPSELPFAKWPTLQPMMVVQAPGCWGFVYPLVDETLGSNVLQHWAKIKNYVLPEGTNFVAASTFDGDCFAERPDAPRWRLPTNKAGWNERRKVDVEVHPSEANNVTLSLCNLDHSQTTQTLGCYQAIPQGLPPGSRAVLRFRARSLHGKGTLSVGLGMPLTIPDDNTVAAQRLHQRTTALPTPPGNPSAKIVLYSVATRIRPQAEWQTFVLIWDVPPYPTQALHRNLVIDVVGLNEQASDHVWVDDVEMFVWPWGKSS